MGKFFKNILTRKDEKSTSLEGVKIIPIPGANRTSTSDTRTNVSLMGIVDSKDGKRKKPGFTPDSAYSVGDFIKAPNGWYGNLLDSHIDNINFSKRNLDDTNTKFEESKSKPEIGDNYSTRDYYLIFNDSSQDYFKHGLHIEGRTPIKTALNDRNVYDGSDSGLRLQNFVGTSHEQNDPVIYGFELVIDALSSPLLNGSVEDFVNGYKNVSEIISRRNIIYDFKRQFQKIFKTKGSIFYDKDQPPVLMSGASNKYAESTDQSSIYRGGKKTYLGYYLQKISGLANLIEANTGEKNKSFVTYETDKITLSFLEDVSGTMGALAHLYKLLYWSKPNGKNIVPENLLRFNCDIIVSEVRNFNRVRKALDTGDIEVLKDNVSRYIYSLKECQFFFDKLPHEDSIDLGGIKVYGDGQAAYDVSFNFKYSTTKFEKWTPDPQNFGQYVGYNNGALWKIGNKGSRESRKTELSVEGNPGNSGNIIDNSIPKFLTVGTNTLRQNGVTKAFILDSFNSKISPKVTAKDPEPEVGPAGASSSVPTTASNTNKNGDSVGEDEEAKGAKKEERKKKISEGFESFKKNAKKAGARAAKGALNFAIGQINNQINVRAKLLESTILRIQNALGLGGLDSEPKNIYRPYKMKTKSAYEDEGILMTANTIGMSKFFDVRNEIFNFVSEETASMLSSGSKLLNPFQDPKESKFLKNVPSINTIINKFSIFKPSGSANPLDLTQVKFGYVSYSNKKWGTLKNITDSNSKANSKWGVSDYNKIQFPKSYQKYPSPINTGTYNLEEVVKSSTKWSYPVNDKKFGK